MKVLVAVKRVVDYNVKVRPKSDGSGVKLIKKKGPLMDSPLFKIDKVGKKK